MEKRIALVNKKTNRVENVLIVDSLETDHIQIWATEQIQVIPVTHSEPYVYGLWNGLEFEQPTDDYLLEIGVLVIQPEVNEEITE